MAAPGGPEADGPMRDLTADEDRAARYYRQAAEAIEAIERSPDHAHHARRSARKYAQLAAKKLRAAERADPKPDPATCPHATTQEYMGSVSCRDCGANNLGAPPRAYTR